MNWPAISAAAAWLGLGLGLFNLVIALLARRVQLRVEASTYVSSKDERGLMIEVINLSAFPVFLSKVCFELSPSHKSGLRRIVDARVEQELPYKLESRQAKQFYFQPYYSFSEHAMDFQNAVVETDCGRIYRNRSKWLVEHSEDVRKIRERVALNRPTLPGQ